MDKSKEPSKPQLNNSFSDHIFPISLIFKNHSHEILYRQSKFEKKNILTIITFLVLFNTLITAIRMSQRLVTTIYSTFTIKGDFSISEYIGYNSLYYGSILIETLFFLCKRISIFRGFIGALAPFVGTIYRSYKVSTSLNTDYPLFLSFSIYQLINIIVISTIYTSNWICGMIIILLTDIIFCVYACLAPWSWFTDKPITIFNYTTCAFILIFLIYYFDYTHRKSFFRRLISESEKNNLNEIVSKHPDPIIIAYDGQIASRNEAFNNLLNSEESSSSSSLNDSRRHLHASDFRAPKSIDDSLILSSIVQEESNQSMLNLIRNSIKDIANKKFKFKTTDKKKTINFEVTSVNLGNKLIMHSGILYYLRNVSSSIKLSKAKSKTKYLSLYMSSITHDFRTPLSIIEGNMEQMAIVLHEDKELMQNISNIRKSVSILTLLVQDILDASSIKANKFQLRLSRINIMTLIEEMIELFTIKYKDKGLFLVKEYSNNLPLQICTDESRLKQIFFNLLSNAYKFTLIGGVTISVDFELETNRLILQVKDTGVGISPNKIGLLFDPFQKLDEHSTLNPNGIGLGLYNCKNLIQKLQGDIKVTSELGLGTTFTIILTNIYQKSMSGPLNLSLNMNINQNNALMPHSGNSQEAAIEDLKDQTFPILNQFEFEISNSMDQLKKKKFCKCPKILIVDDDEGCRSIYKFYLNQYNIHYIEAKNGKEAISLVEDFYLRECCNYLRIILIDNFMPELTGIQASFHLRKFLDDHNLTNTRIILASGDNSEFEPKERNLFWKILVKPISSKVFKEEIINYILRN